MAKDFFRTTQETVRKLNASERVGPKLDQLN